LLLLNGDIVLHETVAPACLWRDDSIEFKELEATGWGKTHAAQRSEELMKVKLRPFKNSECSNYYDPTFRMKDGIRPTQLCAGDFKSDTCWGDSGGPLEVKLLGAGHLTPFLVGVTSFGRGCGSQVPGVYTRVSSYIDWIEQSLNHTVLTDPIECTLRYKRYREYEPNVISKRISNFIEIDESLRHIKDDNFFTKHVVSMHQEDWFLYS
jgi:Trypsin